MTAQLDFISVNDWSRAIAATESGYGARLRSVAARICGDVHGACDIVQDVFMQILTKKPKFRGDSTLATYVYRMVVNRSIDYRRRTKRRRWSSDDLLNLSSADTSEKVFTSMILAKALERMNEIYKIPLILADSDGLSYGEISVIIGIPINTVRTRIFRAREKMREELHSLGVFK